MTQQNIQQKLINKWNEMDNEETQMKGKMATKKRKLMDEFINGMDEKDEKIVKLEEENQALKEKMAFYKKELKSLQRRQIPSELLIELYSSMPLENAFGLLTKMKNGLLAKNVQKMINGIKEALKNNKLNSADSGSELVISEDGLEVKHSGLDDGMFCIRAFLPFPILKLKAINKPIISFYFEMEILNDDNDSLIGFCDHQFPLENVWLGVERENSIGIYYKSQIWIGESPTEFENFNGDFKKGDFVGIGIICQSNSKIECFGTWNGKLLGKAELPSKFADLRLFPAFNLYHEHDSIGVNFGIKEWQFKEFGRVLQ